VNSKLHECRTNGRAAHVDAIPEDGLRDVQREEVQISVDGVTLEAELTMPRSATGIVLFAHGSGSGRHSPRNQFVAWNLQCAGLGTLLLDLLTSQDELDDTLDGHLRFDVRLLARRLIAATIWSATHDVTRNLSVGYFGASTGAAAALIAASRLGPVITAIVSRGGRLDLASRELPRVVTPTLLIVGGRDEPVLELNRSACAQLSCEKRLEIVPNATHLFEEPWTLNAVAALASDWFRRHLAPNFAPINLPVV
jgi:putative phosphoribosyl transferase